VVDNFKVAWAKGYGVTEAGGNNPVTVHTLFQAGSISKPVAATGTLSLVEQGRLSLDEKREPETEIVASPGQRIHQRSKSHLAPHPQPQRRPYRPRLSRICSWFADPNPGADLQW